MSRKRANQPAVKQPVQTNDSFANFGANVGWGTNNQSSGSTYTLSYQSRNRIALEAAYRGSWIVRAAVDAMPEDMTRAGIEISGMEPEDVTLIERDMMRLAIWDALCDDGKWANLYGGSLAVMLVEGQDFSTPLDPDRIAKGQFKGLLILDRWMVSPLVGEVVTEYGPDMGKPVYYNVIADYAAIPKAKIHYSRVIRLDGMDLPFYQRVSENGWGLSVLEPMWDRLIAFDSASVGAGQLIYKAHLRTMTIEGLRDVIALGGPALAGLKAQIEFTRLAQTNEGMTLVDGKDKFEAHTYAFSGLSDMLTQFAQQLCGALGMPFTRLFGQSPTGLSATGEGEMKQWGEKVKQQQERRLRNPVHRLLAVMSMSTLGKPLPDDFGFEFRSLQEMNELEKSDIATKKTAAIVSAVDAQLIKPSTGMKELKASAPVSGLFGNISDSDISEAEKLEKEAPPPEPDENPPEMPKNPTNDSFFKRFMKR